MQVGDLIQFCSTGVLGLIVDVRPEGSTEFVYVLCGADIDGICPAGETTAFPRLHIEMVAEVINASR